MTLWTAVWQSPLSMGFSRQEYWSGLPFSPPGDLPNPGIEPVSLMSPALAGRFFTTRATWEALYVITLRVKRKIISPSNYASDFWPCLTAWACLAIFLMCHVRYNQATGSKARQHLIKLKKCQGFS